MTRLCADRFLAIDGTPFIDLATGEQVLVEIQPSGTRTNQAAWASACASALGHEGQSGLIDFGFVGPDRRFEARRTSSLRSRSSFARDIPRSLVDEVVEWLEEHRVSARLIQIGRGELPSRRWIESLARAVRVAGFIPLNVKCANLIIERPALIAGRSIALFDDDAIRDQRQRLCLSILRLAGQPPRSISAIIGSARHNGRVAEPMPAPQAGIAHAAESRPRYIPARTAGFSDARSLAQLEDARAQARRGRHAAAERTLRSAVAAFDRRNDFVHAADAALFLGSVLSSRGRVLEAASEFRRAHDLYQRCGAAAQSTTAFALIGLAETDAGSLERAQNTLQAAYSAATALADEHATLLSGVALARNLFWQQRFRESLETLVPFERHDCPRVWSLAARVRLATGQLAAASECASRARQAMAGRVDPTLEAVVRSVSATLQARLGDLDALYVHARHGILAASAAHLPLQAFRIRLTVVEGLLDAGASSRARKAARGLRAPLKSLPSLLRRRTEEILERVASDRVAKRPAVHEAAAIFQVDHSDAVTRLLTICHSGDDERNALKAVAELVRTESRAIAVGVFAASAGAPATLATAGTIAPRLARRCIDLGLPIAPEAQSSQVEAAVPVLYLGRTLGAITCRWTVQSPYSSNALSLMRVAAASCAPLIQIVHERNTPPPMPVESDDIELVGISDGIQHVRRLAKRAASAPFSVLVEGESGSGKELVARAIHRAGARRDKPFCALNCAALTEELVDSELFGHAKGAFTGALTERLGLFESAGAGTLFLDEVGELSARAQAKLLRAIQEGEIKRIGENFTRPIDARLIAATNRSLTADVEAGTFRQDLLYRLDVLRIVVPPLRERRQDIPMLTARFWREATDRIGSKASLGPAAVAALARYDWPGNVRELQNVLASLAVAVPPRGTVAASALPAAVARAAHVGSSEPLDVARRRFEEHFVRAALANAGGHRARAAASLGLSRQGLAKLLRRLNLPDK